MIADNQWTKMSQVITIFRFSMSNKKRWVCWKTCTRWPGISCVRMLKTQQKGTETNPCYFLGFTVDDSSQNVPHKAVPIRTQMTASWFCFAPGCEKLGPLRSYSKTHKKAIRLVYCTPMIYPDLLSEGPGLGRCSKNTSARYDYETQEEGNWTIMIPRNKGVLYVRMFGPSNLRIWR